ncbi:HAD family hydrolase [Caldinitratiruptor microaerophilus]|uniref:Haloacid dehalogenase n=1 Tax=Caldinitratiruptor microaerophilus TaxID=671077 RepID=A0AA35G8P1_9FIRM|nr:HAD family hydrolase [Caldinitratiruptor microaerophilus]BDG61235.1 haloacid dehalogenase [Caldinitratiruptor microaerophilus]
MVRAVLFDLDGTLFPVDTDAFIAGYMKRLAEFSAHLVAPETFTEALWESTMAMIRNTDPALTNEEVFWAHFSRRLGRPREELEPHFLRFYRQEYPRLRPADLDRAPASRAAVEAATRRGCAIVLATNPLFPAEAIRERMRWAGVLDYPWAVVTTIENMHACKPRLEYYEEVLGRLGLRPEECVMVGNDVEEDGVAARLGMPVYIATDFLIDRRGTGPPADSGPLAAFPGWLENRFGA